MRSDKQAISCKRGQILVRHRTQTQLLKTLHLNAVMNDVAERKDLATEQGPLCLADGSDHAEAETRIIINLYTHCSYL